MSRKPLLLVLSTITCFVMFLARMMAQYSGDYGRTVQVSVQATDSYPLHYQWRSTDGTIQNVDAATTTWTLAHGLGLHFAYVLVSNHMGGYTERRIAINTDTLATESEAPEEWPEITLHAKPGPAQVGDYYRGRLDYNYSNAAGTAAYIPNAAVFLQDFITNSFYPPTGSVQSNQRGEFIIPGVIGSGDGSDPLEPQNVALTCQVFGVSSNCTSNGYMLSEATSDYHQGVPAGNQVVGTLTLADSITPCGTYNEFFGVHVTAKATLLDLSNNVLAGPVDVNAYGDYGLPADTNGVTVSLTCEGASPVPVAFNGGNTNPLLPQVVPGVYPPTVTNMTATLNGQPLPASVAKFLPPPTGLPSDISSRTDNYLAEKGVDSRLSGCKYYQAIGAVQGCGPKGESVGAINYQQWQKAVKIGKYAEEEVPTYKASYINKVDLNLARVHQSITYGPNQTAAVVCNHLGPLDFFTPAQGEIDTAVENAVANKNLVACVAMDYEISAGVNNNKPFVRFYIFGPSGQLLSSVNLDGRGEKFVPGTCVVCHGGDHYAGKFPEDGSGFANIGGHFLPYDAGNFEFASKPGLQRCDQENAIYHLNRNILNAGPTVAEQELVQGWYSTQGTVSCPSPRTHVLNEDYVPVSWQSQDKTSTDFYKGVVARSCRTCHVAMLEGLNFDHYANIGGNGTPLLPGGAIDFTDTVCSPGTPHNADPTGVSNSTRNFLRWATMPNSLVTFNRFWLSYQNAIGLPDQGTLLMNFAAEFNSSGCTPVLN